MPIFKRGDARIYYEETGTGFPLLILHGGGLNSLHTFARGPFDTVETFRSQYRCITMDLRNASGGQSTGPLDLEHPWDMYTDDQLDLLDHLGIDRFHVLGFCIGNPLMWNLIQRAGPRRGRRGSAAERRRSWQPRSLLHAQSCRVGYGSATEPA